MRQCSSRTVCKQSKHKEAQPPRKGGVGKAGHAAKKGKCTSIAGRLRHPACFPCWPFFASIPPSDKSVPEISTDSLRIPYDFNEAFLMSEHIHYVTDDNFATEVLQSPQPVLVDYWAEWCGPCKMIAPILDEVAKEYAGKLKVAKLNIDDNQKTPAQYGIRGIPTLMLFKGGNIEATKVGALSKGQLTAFIDSNL